MYKLWSMIYHIWLCFTAKRCRMQNRPDFELMRSSLRAPEATARGPHPRPAPRAIKICQRLCLQWTAWHEFHKKDWYWHDLNLRFEHEGCILHPFLSQFEEPLQRQEFKIWFKMMWACMHALRFHMETHDGPWKTIDILYITYIVGCQKVVVP